MSFSHYAYVGPYLTGKSGLDLGEEIIECSIDGIYLPNKSFIERTLEFSKHYPAEVLSVSPTQVEEEKDLFRRSFQYDPTILDLQWGIISYYE